MKERPILMSGTMVRAILEGRKTITRRVVRSRLIPVVEECFRVNGKWCNHTFDYELGELCPYGQPGDRLWVRETWKPHCEGPISDEFPLGTCVKYRADGACVKPTTWDNDQGAWCEAHEEDTKWHPSIFMPRWASRITLEITGMRVERVQDIKAEDALAEGSYLERCPCLPKNRDRTPIEAAFSQTECYIHGEEFKHLWDSINAKRGFSWASNPWVWVLSFRLI